MHRMNIVNYVTLSVLLCTLNVAMAQGPLPSILGPINYDPIGSSTFVIARGGGSVRITDAANRGSVPASNLGSVPLGGDSHDLPAAPWNWEILLTNLTTSMIVVPIVISLPNGKTLRGSQKIAPPSATSSGSEYFNLIIDEPTEGIFGGADTVQGNFYVTVTPPARGNYEPNWIGFDTSIVEEIGNVELRSTQFEPRPGNFFSLADTLTIAIGFDGFGPNLDSPPGNMGLGLNGMLPSAAGMDHRVPVPANGPLTLELSSAVPQQKFILLGDTVASGGSTNLPWGGTLDLASPGILMNGITPVSFFDSMAVSDFFFTANIDCTETGSSWPALQAIYQEASMPPFFYNHTDVGQAYFPTTVTSFYHDLPDDGFIQHDLCGSIDYIGVTYTSLYICANGQITFDQGSTLFAPSAVEFFSGFLPAGNQPNPGVAPIWTDLNRSSDTGDWIKVSEDTLTGITTVRHYNQTHWASGTPAGSWKFDFGSLGPNSVVFNIGGYLPGVPQTDDDPITGVTDGNNTPIGPGMNNIVDFSQVFGGAGGPYFTAPGAEPESIMEQFALAGSDPAAPFDLTTLSFNDAGGIGSWTIF